MDSTEKINKLIEKLDNIIHQADDNSSAVSPTPTCRDLKNHDIETVHCDSTPDVQSFFSITEDVDLEKLSRNDLILLHTRLHMHYPRGTEKLSKDGIERLHTKIKNKIYHINYDMLDKK